MSTTSGYLITLDQSLGDEATAALTAALLQLRGVIAVEPVQADFDQQLGEARAYVNVEMKLLHLYRTIRDKS